MKALAFEWFSISHGVGAHCQSDTRAHPAVMDREGQFPFEVEGFEIDALPVQGHTLKVARDGDRFRVWLDGQAAAEGKVGEAATLSLA